MLPPPTNTRPVTPTDTRPVEPALSYTRPVELALSDTRPVELALSDTRPVEPALSDTGPIEPALSDTRSIEQQQVLSELPLPPTHSMPKQIRTKKYHLKSKTTPKYNTFII